MATMLQGDFLGHDKKIGIVVSRFNEFISSKLLAGALDALQRHGVADENISVAWVPGAFEIPLAAQKVAQDTKIDAVICLGAVIRGSTPHFEYVSAEVSKGIAQVGLKSGKPVIYGILTTDSVEQAIERAGTKSGNKGFAAAASALEMVDLMKELGHGHEA